MGRVYKVAQFILIEQQQSLAHKDDCVTSHCIYQFTCNCGQLAISNLGSLNMYQNGYQWTQIIINNNSLDRHPASSIAQHLVGSGRRLQDPNSNKSQNFIQKLQGKMSYFIEALATRENESHLMYPKTIDPDFTTTLVVCEIWTWHVTIFIPTLCYLNG